MAGVKGRSGGARPGAGRKKAETVVIPAEIATAVNGQALNPLPALELVALGHLEVSALQMKALLALLPYTNAKKGEGGKKDERNEAAKRVASRFAPAAPPKLVAAGGKKV